MAFILISKFGCCIFVSFFSGWQAASDGGARWPPSTLTGEWKTSSLSLVRSCCKRSFKNHKKKVLVDGCRPTFSFLVFTQRWVGVRFNFSFLLHSLRLAILSGLSRHDHHDLSWQLKLKSVKIKWVWPLFLYHFFLECKINLVFVFLLVFLLQMQGNNAFPP